MQSLGNLARVWDGSLAQGCLQGLLLTFVLLVYYTSLRDILLIVVTVTVDG